MWRAAGLRFGVAEAPDDTHSKTAEDAGRALGLLAGGVSLSQAAAALPDDANGRRWRRATPALVGLHLLAGRLEEPAEEPLGDTRAGVLLAQHRATLVAAFGSGFPAEVQALVAEVERLLAARPRSVEAGRPDGPEATAASPSQRAR